MRPFDASSGTAPAQGKWQVTEDLTREVYWRQDGQELLYLTMDREAETRNNRNYWSTWSTWDRFLLSGGEMCPFRTLLCVCERVSLAFRLLFSYAPHAQPVKSPQRQRL